MIENKLTTIKSADIIQFNDEQVALIKRTIAPQATDDELKIFLHQCKKTGLDPLSKQIYFQKFKDKMTIIVGIDGYRLIADRTGCYAGSDEAIYDNEEKPAKATVTVFKMVAGLRCPFKASARWDQYCPPSGRDHMWKKFPHLMLGKCAEGLALRKAFPAELSGVYIKEEMDQAKQEAPQEIKEVLIDSNTGEVLPDVKKLFPDPIQKMLVAFADIGVQQSEVEGLVGTKLENFNENTLTALRAIYGQKKREAFDKQKGDKVE